MYPYGCGECDDQAWLAEHLSSLKILENSTREVLGLAYDAGPNNSGFLRKRLPLFFPLALSRRGEVPDGTLHFVAVAIGFRRLNLVVVGRRWFEAVHAHAKNRIRTGRVQPDW